MSARIAHTDIRTRKTAIGAFSQYRELFFRTTTLSLRRSTARRPSPDRQRKGEAPLGLPALTRVHSGWAWHTRIPRTAIRKKSALPDALRNLQATQPIGALLGAWNAQNGVKTGGKRPKMPILAHQWAKIESQRLGERERCQTWAWAASGAETTESFDTLQDTQAPKYGLS